MDALSQETITIIVGVAVIAGFFWSLHRDLAGLRDRISRLEGMFEGLRDSVNRLELRFDRLEQRFNGLEQRFGGFEQRFGGFEQRFGGFEQRFNDRFPPPPAAGG